MRTLSFQANRLFARNRKPLSSPNVSIPKKSIPPSPKKKAVPVQTEDYDEKKIMEEIDKKIEESKKKREK